MAKPHTSKKRKGCLSWEGTMGTKHCVIFVNFYCPVGPRISGFLGQCSFECRGKIASLVKGSNLRYIQDLRNNCQANVGETNPQRGLVSLTNTFIFTQKLKMDGLYFEISLISGNSPSIYDNPIASETLLKRNAFTLGPLGEMVLWSQL